MNLVERARYVMKGEDGAISLEMVGWIAILLVILSVALLLRNNISDKVREGADAVGSMELQSSDSPGQGNFGK